MSKAVEAARNSRLRTLRKLRRKLEIELDGDRFPAREEVQAISRLQTVLRDIDTLIFETSDEATMKRRITELEAVRDQLEADRDVLRARIAELETVLAGKRNTGLDRFAARRAEREQAAG